MVKVACLLTSMFSLSANAQNSTAPQSRKFSAIVDMIAYTLTTTHEPSVLSKMIQNYGCHCFPGYTRSTGGLGAPVDDLDNECRKLYRCKKCVNIEFPGAVLDVDQGKYKYSVNSVTGINCNANTEAGKLAQCECDKEFAIELGTFWQDSNYNKHYWTNTKNVNQLANAGTPIFDKSSTCIATGANDAPDACCGDSFPSKIPYSTTTRSCCSASAKTYDPVTSTCCMDGTIKAPGAC